MKDGQYKKVIFLVVFSIVLLGISIGLLYAILQKPKDVENHYFIAHEGRFDADPIAIQKSSDSENLTIVESETKQTGQGTPDSPAINSEVVKTTTISNTTVQPPKPKVTTVVDYTNCLIKTFIEGADTWQSTTLKDCTPEVRHD